ncbi:MAG TPA: hypothetical protein VJH90_03195 [archaeon]|nr:hypothetical protein [archaeon]
MKGVLPAVYLKLIGELVVAFLLLYVVLSPQGVVSNTVTLQTLVEPIVIQSFIVSSVDSAANSQGEYETYLKTNGVPHKISVYEENGFKWIKVKPSTQAYLKMDYADLKPEALLIGDCKMDDVEIELAKGKTGRITLKKTLAPACKIEVGV